MDGASEDEAKKGEQGMGKELYRPPNAPTFPQSDKGMQKRVDMVKLHIILNSLPAAPAYAMKDNIAIVIIIWIDSNDQYVIFLNPS